MMLAAFLGTIVDHYFVSKNLYYFPIRPFPQLFSINIGFTLVVLPIFVFIFLRLMSVVNKWGRLGLILFLSLLAPILERLAEACGLFIHSNDWKHLYSFFGYLVFLTITYRIYLWTNPRR
jgi:hypothetical protein